MGRRPSEILGLISEPPGLPPLTGGPEDDLWSYSPERTWYMRRRPKIAAFVALAVALVIVAGLLGQPPRTPPEAWWSAIVGAIGLVVGSYCLFPYGAARKAFKERQRWMSRYRAEEALRRFDRCESGIPIDALFRYNRRQLDAYQELSRNQQRLAFRHAQAASLAGLVVLVVGVALSFRIAPGGPSYAVAGLTGLGRR